MNLGFFSESLHKIDDFRYGVFFKSDFWMVRAFLGSDRRK